VPRLQPATRFTETISAAQGRRARPRECRPIHPSGAKCGGRIQQLTAAFAIVACLITSGCSGITQNHVSTTSANNTVLTLNVSKVDFGSVALGSSKTHSITLTNASAPGAAAITVSQADITGPGFSVKAGSLPVTIPPGSSVSLTVAFTPTVAGAQQGSLSVAAPGLSSPLSAGLTGTGMLNAKLTVSPARLNFGSVTVGNSATQGGTLTAGTSDITLSAAQWSGSGFAVNGLSFPLTVSAGKSVTYSVVFTPDAAGQVSGSISFASDAANSPGTQTFAGTGEASGAAQHSVSLSWIAISSPAARYNLYRGTTSGGPYAKLTASPQNGTSYVDHSVEPGTIYYYVATAVDANAQESGYSEEVVAQVPSQ